MTVEIIDHGWKKIAAAAMNSDCTVEVGVLDDTEAFTLQLVSWHHEGTHKHGKQHSPPRPFMDIAMAQSGGELAQKCEKAAQAPLSGRSIKPEAKQAGEWMATEIKEQIYNGIPPANAESTLRQKSGTTPLIDKANRIPESIKSRLK